MFHRVFTPPCLCSTTSRKVLCSIVSSLHLAYVPQPAGGFYVPSCFCSTMSMFHRVFSPPRLWSSTGRRVLCSIVSLLLRVYVPLCPYSTMSMFHNRQKDSISIVSLLHHVHVSPCVCSRVRVRVRIRHDGPGLELGYG